MVTVEVVLYASLRKYLPEAKLGEGVPVRVGDASTVDELLEGELGIPSKEVKIVFVNAVSRKGNHVLSDGDRVAVFPPVGGG